MSPEVLIHIDMSGKDVEAGDYVVTGPDAELAKELQLLSGLWKDDMEEVSQGQTIGAACRSTSERVCVLYRYSTQSQ